MQSMLEKQAHALSSVLPLVVWAWPLSSGRSLPMRNRAGRVFAPVHLHAVPVTRVQPALTNPAAACAKDLISGGLRRGNVNGR